MARDDAPAPAAPAAAVTRAGAAARAGVWPPRARLYTVLERLVFGTALYRLTLSGGAPDSVLRGLSLRPAGNAEAAAALMRGEFMLAGERVTAEDPWLAMAGEPWRNALHGFGWLADLQALGSDAARKRARDLIDRWIARYGDWSLGAWRGDVLGRRIVAWLGAYDFFCASADDGFRARVFRSLGRQLRHLDRLARFGGAALGPAGHGRVEALAGLAQAYAVLPGNGERLIQALAALQRECDRQVLPDGGHYQRSPALQFTVLRDLVGVRATLLAGRQAVPDGLQGTIDRLAPMLRFFRHGDGRLALFNGTAEGDAAEIDGVLALADAAGKPPASAPHTGFQRLTAGRLLALIDVGEPPPAESDGYAHAGTLSFELSLAKERLVVNCGARQNVSAEWRQAQGATAAHSTLVLGAVNSAEVLASGQLGRRPRHVICRREESEGATLVDASHDGYAETLGALHRRRIYMAPGGDDLRGEDWLSRIRPGDPLAFAVRFHLHPDVQASLVHDGTAALLRLPSGAGFRFDAAGGRVALAESIYLGGAGGVRRTEQIVVESNLAGEQAGVRWSFKRVGGES